ncbi:MAG: hypothetical protein ACREAU_00230 [Nitrosopumilaceae archaeon]
MKLVSKKLYKENTKVVDIQVKDSHNFAVSNSKIIVHNSYLRPRGAFIGGIGVETPGAIKYMELFDKSSDVITSGSGTKSTFFKAKGKIRKGAQMAVLDCTHPDIVEFITAKQQPGRLTKFNVSVNCTDEFMEKVLRVQQLKDQDASQELIDETDQWNLRFPDTTSSLHKTEWDGDLKEWEEKGYPTKIYKTVSATWLWNLIMESTYNRAEPGILFLDRANYFNPFNYGEKIFATNPCGEQLLSPGNICCLGSINLTQFVNTTRDDFDYDEIIKYTQYLIRFLDNINSISTSPLQEYTNSARNKRRVGCGILGWGSALFMMKVRFSSKRADELREKMMSTIARTAYMASIDLAEEKGMFPLCNPKKHALNPFVINLDLPEEYISKMLRFGIRNSSLLSIQPTGNCVTADGVILTNDGFVNIQTLLESVVPNMDNLQQGDVVKLKEEIHIPTLEGEDKFDSIYVNGKQEVFQLTLNTGLTLKQTLNHKYLVKVNENIAEWVEVKDLKPGMKIIALDP